MKKFVTLLLVVVMSIGSLLGLTACGKKDDDTNKGDVVWNLQTIYAQAQDLGYNGTLEEFLATVKGATGEKGEKGEKGEQGLPGQMGLPGMNGKDGVGIANVKLDEDGHLLVVLTDKTEIDLGKITDGKETLEEQLYAAIAGAKIGGMTFTGEVLMRADSIEDLMSIITLGGAFSFGEDGVNADVQILDVLPYDGMMDAYYGAMFIRESGIYGGEYYFENGLVADPVLPDGGADVLNGTEDGAADETLPEEVVPYQNIEEYLTAIENGDEALKLVDNDMFGNIINVIGELLSVKIATKGIVNLPRVLGGKATAQKDGTYTLEYDLMEEINDILDFISYLAETIDADKTMTVSELVELEEVKTVLQNLLYGATAQELKDFIVLRNGNSEEFAATLPNVNKVVLGTDGTEETVMMTAYEYLLAYLGDKDEETEVAIGDAIVYDMILGAISEGIPAELLPSLEIRWNCIRVALEERILSEFPLGFGVKFFFDEEQTLTGMKVVLSITRYDDYYKSVRGIQDYTEINLTFKFTEKAPELIDLSKAKYVESVKWTEKTYTDVLNATTEKYETNFAYKYDNKNLTQMKFNPATCEGYVLTDATAITGTYINFIKGESLEITDENRETLTAGLANAVDGYWYSGNSADGYNVYYIEDLVNNEGKFVSKAYAVTIGAESATTATEALENLDVTGCSLRSIGTEKVDYQISMTMKNNVLSYEIYYLNDDGTQKIVLHSGTITFTGSAADIDDYISNSYKYCYYVTDSVKYVNLNVDYEDGIVDVYARYYGNAGFVKIELEYELIYKPIVEEPVDSNVAA